MSKEQSQRIRALKVYEILCQETDEDNPLGTTMLISKLNMSGIDCDRKTLYKDIKALNDYGFDVMCNREQCNKYYVVSRKFDIPELRILIDAVQAASFITPNKTKELIDKIASLGGSNRGNVLKNTTAFNTVKQKNEGIYYNIAALDEGIIAKLQVSFAYFDYSDTGKRVYRKDGERYIVNPLALVFNDNNYYLVCYNDKYQNISNYRVDRMEDVRVEETKILKSNCTEGFNLAEYRKQTFSMYGGELTEVEIEFHKSLTDVIYDKFGSDILITRIADDWCRVAVNVVPSPVFFGWCAALADKLKILSPKSIINNYITLLNVSLKQYF